MERRVLLAIFLCFLVLYAWQALIVRPGVKPGTTGATPAGATPAPGADQAAAPAPASVPPPDLAPAMPAVSTLVADSDERDVRIETPHVIAVFTNRGGRLKSWRLKAYQDANHEPLELVTTELARSQPLPFSLDTADKATSDRLNGALYAVQQSDTGVTFEYRDSAGIHAVKEFQLDPATYTLTFRAAASQDDQPLAAAVAWGPGLGDQDSQAGRYAVKPGGIFSAAGKISRLAASKVATQPAYEDDFEYVGVDDLYFMTAAVKPGRAKVTYHTVNVPPAPGTTQLARDLMAYTLEPANHGEALTYYVGPKDFDALAKIDRSFVKAINFGMFSVLVVPLLRSLNWIYGYVGNYGWAILILTVFINVVLFPLNHKSVVSMRKMQEIQPEVKAIQERYSKLKATDPAKQKMNQEMMALYRERGVSPASGCIPIVLTLPVFLAFYALLTTAIELRGAPFIGWIHDLSQPDPYYAMPILVGLSQVWQQWMTPATGMDPAQQKMMMIMPIVLIFVFVSTPSGALIYWLVGNVWRVGQMQLTNYMIGPPHVRIPGNAAAERRLKRVGGGKTESAAKEN
jgi:YidC/Oxa1 family membrane protein insertase